MIELALSQGESLSKSQHKLLICPSLFSIGDLQSHFHSCLKEGRGRNAYLGQNESILFLQNNNNKNVL